MEDQKHLEHLEHIEQIKNKAYSRLTRILLVVMCILPNILFLWQNGFQGNITFLYCALLFVIGGCTAWALGLATRKLKLYRTRRGVISFLVLGNVAIILMGAIWDRLVFVIGKYFASCFSLQQAELIPNLLVSFIFLVIGLGICLLVGVFYFPKYQEKMPLPVFEAIVEPIKSTAGNSAQQHQHDNHDNHDNHNNN